jgi:hypothetical protein
MISFANAALLPFFRGLEHNTRIFFGSFFSVIGYPLVIQFCFYDNGYDLSELLNLGSEPPPAKGYCNEM